MRDRNTSTNSANNHTQNRKISYGHEQQMNTDKRNLGEGIISTKNKEKNFHQPRLPTAHMNKQLKKYQQQPQFPYQNNPIETMSLLYKISHQIALTDKDHSKINNNYSLVIGCQNKNNQLADIAELLGENPKDRSTMTNFWRQILNNFQMRNKFINNNGANQLIQLHIKYNKQFYYPSGHFNTDHFIKHQAFLIKQGIIIAINNKSELFLKIINNLQDLLKKFIISITIIILKINNIYQIKKQNKNLIIRNIHKCLIILLKYSKQQNQFYLQYIEQIIKCYKYCSINLSQLLKQKQIYQLLYQLQQSYYIINQQFINNIAQQMQQLIISCLLIAPYKYNTWDNQLNDLIMQAKCKFILPFQTLLCLKNSYKILKYHQIKGFHWKLFIDVILRLYSSHYNEIKNKEYQFIFRSICSILESNVQNYWLHPEQYQLINQFIHNIIVEIHQINLSNNIISKYIYKICRIMICTLGYNNNSKIKNNNNNTNLQLKLKSKYTYQCIIYFNEQIYLYRKSINLFAILFEQIQINQYNNNNNNINQYNYFTIDVIYQLFLKIIILQPTIINDNNIFIDNNNNTNFIQKITLEYLNAIFINFQYIQLQTISLIFQTINSLLLIQQTRQIGKELIKKIMQQNKNQYLRQTLIKNNQYHSIISQHLKIMIQINLKNNLWFIHLTKYFNQLSKQLHPHSLSSFAQFFIYLFNQIIQSNYKNNNQYIHQFNKQNIINAIKNNKQINKNHYQRQNYFILEKLNYTFIFQYIQWSFTLIHHNDTYYRNQLLLNNKFKQLNIGVQLLRIICKVYLETGNQYLSQLIIYHLKKSNKQGQHQLKLQNGKCTSYLCALGITYMNFKKNNNLKYNNDNILQCMIWLMKIQNYLGNSTYQFNIYQNYSLSAYSLPKIYHNYHQQFINYLKQNITPTGLKFYLIDCNKNPDKSMKDIINTLKDKLKNHKVQEEQTLEVLAEYIKYVIKQYPYNNRIIIEHKQQIQQTLDTMISIVHVQKSYSDSNRKMLNNIWQMLIILQKYDKNMYVYCLKRLHRLILHPSNIITKIIIDGSSKYENKLIIYQNYYIILQLFLTCKGYLDNKYYKIIQNIPTLTSSLNSFIHLLLELLNTLIQNHKMEQIVYSIVIYSTVMFIDLSTNYKNQLTSIYRMIPQTQHTVSNKMILLILLHYRLQIEMDFTGDQQVKYNSQKLLYLICPKSTNINISYVSQAMKKLPHQLIWITCSQYLLKYIKSKDYYEIVDYISRQMYDILNIILIEQKIEQYRIVWICQILLTLLMQVKFTSKNLDSISQIFFCNVYVNKRIGILLSTLVYQETGKQLKGFLKVSTLLPTLTTKHKIQLLAWLRCLGYLASSIKIQFLYHLINQSIYGILQASSKLSSERISTSSTIENKLIYLKISNQENVISYFNNYLEIYNEIINTQIIWAVTVILIPLITYNSQRKNSINNFGQSKEINKSKQFGNMNYSQQYLNYQENILSQSDELKSNSQLLAYLLMTLETVIKRIINLHNGKQLHTQALPILNQIINSKIYCNQVWLTNSNALSSHIDCNYENYYELLNDTLQIIINQCSQRLKYEKSTLYSDYNKHKKTYSDILKQLKQSGARININLMNQIDQYRTQISQRTSYRTISQIIE